jgi:hypothetical protein
MQCVNSWRALPLWARTWSAEMLDVILGALTAASEADSTMWSGCGMPIFMYLGSYCE